MHGPKHDFYCRSERNELPRAAPFRSARSHALWRRSRHELNLQCNTPLPGIGLNKISVYCEINVSLRGGE